jgi:uncharacterized ferritin-like protein (DUF455 family)
VSLLEIPGLDQKLAAVEDECQRLLLGQVHVPPSHPARDIPVFDRRSLPSRAGLQTSEGQARLLHDLANIELQAMELGVRTLHEFPFAPAEFRHELVSVVLDEARHLRLCLDGICNLGFSWGQWPIHLMLWNTVSRADSLIDRVFIVHGYLEGSGLDAGDQLLSRLSGVINRAPREIVKIIVDEELRHVKFGVSWYRELCRLEGFDPAQDFSARTEKLAARLPARAPAISETARLAAGYTPHEIEFMRKFSERKIRESRV